MPRYQPLPVARRALPSLGRRRPAQAQGVVRGVIGPAGSKGRGRPASSVSVAADTGEVLCLPAVASRKPQSGGRRTSSSADPSIGTVILPSQKSVPNDPKNNCCNMAPALIMTAEESVYNCCLDMCLVCASSDASNGNAMIHSVDCGCDCHVAVVAMR